MKLIRIFSLGLLSGAICFSACTSDTTEPADDAQCGTLATVTYTNSVKAIIDASCAYAGCHAGSAPGDYTTFAGMQNVIDNGKFQERVITLRADANIGMPPDYATAGPTDLTQAELETIQCWIEDGYQE